MTNCIITIDSQATIIPVSGNASNQNWTNSNTYHIISDIWVDANDSLNIAAGTVIKVSYGMEVIVRGTIIASGNCVSQIYFTSANDNTIGDIIGGSTGIPQAGDWKGIYLDGSASFQGAGNFQHCTIRFGGSSSGNAQANIFFHKSILASINNSVIEESA